MGGYDVVTKNRQWGVIYRMLTQAENGKRIKARQVRSTVFRLWYRELMKLQRGECPDLDITNESLLACSPEELVRKFDGVYVKARDLIEAVKSAGGYKQVTVDRKWGTLYRVLTQNINNQRKRVQQRSTVLKLWYLELEEMENSFREDGSYQS
ncbi:hypothetical protein QAD02_019950 [Eretmocerus hayati]|uniref:Uncharacterized protein n=1 Tax=Eretmocerus hayati TaxID=131215 RepID=A0ACC2PL00_9HYME|nr:hypothetical protein QAD02_019950 [Eretmocerus hayati]